MVDRFGHTLTEEIHLEVPPAEAGDVIGACNDGFPGAGIRSSRPLSVETGSAMALTIVFFREGKGRLRLRPPTAASPAA